MKKILSFIINEDNELLLLLGSNTDPQFKRSFWYVVTGGCEPCDISMKETVKREIKEETNLDIINSIYLNWIFKYISLGVECTEYAYISFVKKDKIILNEESIDYKWCDLDEFINLIQWYGDKNFLKNVLFNALTGKIINKTEKIDVFN